MIVPNLYQRSRWRLIPIFLCAFVASTRHAHSYDVCDNRIEVESGESAGPFFGLEYALMAHALAEKFCGAPTVSMSSKFLGYVEKQGCGSNTPIHVALADSIAKLAQANLEALANGDNAASDMSPEQVQEWALTTADELGGCASLLREHTEDFRGGISN